MGQTVLILGESGTGKTTSLRNFKEDEITLIKVVDKNLPFRGRFSDTISSDNYSTIVDAIKKSDKKVIVIDDAQYIMSNEFFRRSKETGWDKFNDIGSNFYKVLHAADSLPDDVFIYILSHTQQDEMGREKIKTIGKVLDEKLTIEGLCTVVLKTVVVDGVYSFQTQNSGHDTCKSPIGMFDNYLIDNDLKMVDSIIREYWGYTDVKPEEKGVAKSGPSLKNPKIKVSEEAKENVLKEAPEVKPSRKSTKKEVKAEVKEETPVEEVKEEVVTEDAPVVEQPKEEVKVEAKPVEQPKTNKDAQYAAIKAKLEAIKAQKNR